MTKGLENSINVGSPWVRLSQEITVLNPNYKEKTPFSADEPLLKKVPNSYIFSIEKGNLVSFSERYTPGDEGKPDHTVVLKILDPNDDFVRTFINNTYIKLFESFISKAINLADFGFIGRTRKNPIDDILPLYYNEEEYDVALGDAMNSVMSAALGKRNTTLGYEIGNNLAPVYAEAENKMEGLLNKKEATDRYTPDIEEQIEAGGFSFDEVDSLIEKDLKAIDGDNLSAKLTSLAISNKKIRLSFGFGRDENDANSEREFVLKNYYSIQDTSQQGVSVIELSSPEYIQEDLSRESPMSRKSPSDEEPQHSVDVPLAQFKTSVNVDLGSQLVFNRDGIPIPEAGIFQQLRFKSPEEGVQFNNIKYITNLIEKLLTRYLEKNIQNSGIFKPIVMLNPTFSDAIAKKIQDELVAYDKDGFAIPGIKSVFTKEVQDDILAVEAIRSTLAAAGIGMSYEVEQEDNDTKVTTVYLEYDAVPLINGRSVAEDQVLATIRRLYSRVNLNARMYNSSDGEVFSLDRPGFKKEFINRLFVRTDKGYNIPMVSRSFISSDIKTTILSREQEERVKATARMMNPLGSLEGVKNYLYEVASDNIPLLRSDSSIASKVVNKKFYQDETIDPYTLDVEGLYKNDIPIISEEFLNIRIYSDEEVITSLVCPLTPNLQEKVIKQYIKRVNESTKLTNSNGVSLAQAFLKRSDIESFESYVKSVQQYYAERGLVNPDTTIPPDAFAYNIETLPDIVSQALEQVPIFIANLQGANVHQVTSKTTGQSFAFLQGNTLFSFFRDNGFKSLEQFFEESAGDSNISASALEGIETAALLDGLRVSFGGNNSLLSLIDTFYQTYSNLFSERQNVSELPIFDIASRKPRRIMRMFLKQLDDSLKNTLANKKVSSNEIIAYFSYLQKLANSVKRLSIKTTPRFKISQEYISKPCLFLNYNPFYAYVSNRLNQRGYLSGVYQIFGYEHVISQSECTSTFYLQRPALANDTLDSIISGKV